MSFLNVFIKFCIVYTFANCIAISAFGAKHQPKSQSSEVETHTADELPLAYKIPTVNTQLDLVRLLLAIHSEAPDFFSDGARFGFDPLELIQEEIRLLSELTKNPEFLQFAQDRPPALQITVRSNKTAFNEETKVDPEAVRNWKQNLIQVAKNTPNIIERLLVLLEFSQKNSSEKIISQMIKNLPESQRSEAYRQSGVEQKIYYFQHHVEKGKELQEALELAINTMNAEREIALLTELSILLQENPGEWINDTEIDSFLKHLDESHYLKMGEFKTYVQPRFEALNQSLKIRRNEAAIKAALIHGIIQSKKINQIESSTANKDSTLLTLQELPVLLAVLRGCIGGDCSSQGSFAAPNNPDELVFIIRNSKGKIKGYLEATRTLVDKVPTLYISSINGPRISRNDVDVILQAMYQDRDKLKVQKIALPKKKKLTALVNYAVISDRLKEYISEGSKVKLKFLQPAIRKQIENFESHFMKYNYDTMEENSEAQLLPDSIFNDDLNILTETQEVQFVPIEMDRKIQVLEILKFANEMTANFEKMSYAMISYLVVQNPEEFKAGIETLVDQEKIENKDHTFYSQLAKMIPQNISNFSDQFKFAYDLSKNQSTLELSKSLVEILYEVDPQGFKKHFTELLNLKLRDPMHLVLMEFILESAPRANFLLKKYSDLEYLYVLAYQLYEKQKKDKVFSADKVRAQASKFILNSCYKQNPNDFLKRFWQLVNKEGPYKNELDYFSVFAGTPELQRGLFQNMRSVELEKIVDRLKPTGSYDPFGSLRNLVVEYYRPSLTLLELDKESNDKKKKSTIEIEYNKTPNLELLVTVSPLMNSYEFSQFQLFLMSYFSVRPDLLTSEILQKNITILKQMDSPSSSKYFLAIVDKMIKSFVAIDYKTLNHPNEIYGLIIEFWKSLSSTNESILSLPGILTDFSFLPPEYIKEALIQLEADPVKNSKIAFMIGLMLERNPHLFSQTNEEYLYDYFQILRTFSKDNQRYAELNVKALLKSSLPEELKKNLVNPSKKHKSKKNRCLNLYY